MTPEANLRKRPGVSEPLTNQELICLCSEDPPNRTLAARAAAQIAVLRQAIKDHIHVEDALRPLAEAGVCVSLCYGPCGALERIAWTVNLLGPDGPMPDNPYAAIDLEHAVRIAVTEATRRGWLETENSVTRSESQKGGRA